MTIKPNQVGIDLGSRFVKIATVHNDCEPELHRYDTVEFYKQFIIRNQDAVCIDIDKLAIPNNYSITATGYGRNLMSFANAEIISEIKAHFRGVARTSKETDFVLIDIGGQDSKVIWAKDGYIEDFVMNDKCAASTGRFAENACAVLGYTIDELGQMTDSPVSLSTTCAVFCESEIISLIASGVDIKRIGAGINLSMAKRLAPLIKTFSAPKIFASGGTAKNKAMLYFMSELIKKDIVTISNSQYNGALGCLECI